MNELPDWRLVLLGDGPMRKRCEELAKELQLERYTFLGFQNPIEYYKSSSLMLMTSNFEGWGLVLTEAMLYGCIPIAFDSFGSIKEIIIDGVNGKLIKPFNINEMSNVIIKLIKSNKLLCLSNEANLSIKRFSPEQIGKEWIRLFNNVISDKSQ
jgi:glycosyltransferase involved in cell wall biosynthesis